MERTFRGSQAHATAMLLVATVCWGLSFPLVKHFLQAAHACPGGEMVANFTLMALRLLLALAVLAVLQPRLFVIATRREMGIGAILGLLQFVGNLLQQLGLARTTPALSGFFTSLACVWIPVLMWLGFRVRLPWVTLLGLGFGLAGAAVMGIDTSKGWALGGGEWLTLASTVIFAVMIVVIDRVGRNLESAHLTIGLITMSGLPALPLVVIWSASEGGIGEWLGWLGTLLREPAVVGDVVALTVFCTVMAILLMATYQPRVPAGRVALIYLVEPIFATLFSIMWGYDLVTARLLVGGTLILGGNLLVELPLWVREFRKGEP